MPVQFALIALDFDGDESLRAPPELPALLLELGGQTLSAHAGGKRETVDEGDGLAARAPWSLGAALQCRRHSWPAGLCRRRSQPPLFGIADTTGLQQWSRPVGWQCFFVYSWADRVPQGEGGSILGGCAHANCQC